MNLLMYGRALYERTLYVPALYERTIWLIGPRCTYLRSVLVLNWTKGSNVAKPVLVANTCATYHMSF